MTSWAITQKLFWSSLLNRLRLEGWEEPTQEPQQRIANLQASMEWLAEFLLADLDHRRPILQEVEDNVLDVLRDLHRDLWNANGGAEAFAKIVISTILKAFSLYGLLEEFDPVFQRIIGYVCGLEMKATQSFEVTGASGESFKIIVTEDEVERQACEILKLVIAGQQPEPLRYLRPCYMGFLLKPTINDPIGGTAEVQPLRLPISQVPLLFLPQVADSSLRQQLFERFRSWFEIAEPPLAQEINKYLPGLIADNPSLSQQSLRNFYRAYLLSTHFQLTRDLARGFDYLADLDLEEIDALCGDMPVWPQGTNFQEVIEASLTAAKDTQKDSSSPQPSTWFLLIEPSRLAFPHTRSDEPMLNQYSEEQYPEILSHGIQTAEADINVFHSLVAGLGLLLHVAYRFPNQKVFVRETEWLLREWLTAHLLKVLRYNPQIPVSSKASILNQDDQLSGMSQPPSLGKSVPVDTEFLRRSIHAKLLRYAFRAIASRSHVETLKEERKTQIQEHDLIGELLIRGAMLSYRLLPILLHYTHIPLEQIDQRLTEVIASKGTPWSHLYAQDQFNPELYGPEAGQYDHLLAGTLAVFREVGFNRATVEGTTEATSSVPFWFTQPVKRALMALANRPENEAERRVREAREGGVPNRLQTYLDRTPQEYATELLRFASPSLSKEEELLRKGQAKLLELFRQASDDVNIDIELLSRGTDHPDMIAHVKVGGEEKRILIEAKVSAEPRHLRQVIAQLQSYIKHFAASYGLIVAPSISERSGKLCEEHDIGYMDLQGNAFIKFEGLFIRTIAARKERQRRGRVKTLFAPVSTRLIRAFLAEPERRWKLQELAAAARISLGQAHKVKQVLLNQEFIGTDPKRRLFLTDPAGLLNAWRETYRYDKNKVLSLFSLDKIPAIEEKVKQYCDARKIRYAFTLFSGAEKLAPFVRYSMAGFYIVGDEEEIIQELQYKPVESGANVLFLSPYDAGVFYGLQESEGFKIVSTLQLYLDLYSYGSRGREQAEFLREKLLAF